MCSKLVHKTCQTLLLSLEHSPTRARIAKCLFSCLCGSARPTSTIQFPRFCVRSITLAIFRGRSHDCGTIEIKTTVNLDLFLSVLPNAPPPRATVLLVSPHAFRRRSPHDRCTLVGGKCRGCVESTGFGRRPDTSNLQVRWSASIMPTSGLRYGKCWWRGVGTARSMMKWREIYRVVEACMTLQKHVSCFLLLLPKSVPLPFCSANTLSPRKTRSHVCPVACGSACRCPSAAFNAHHSTHITRARSAIVCAHVA